MTDQTQPTIELLPCPFCGGKATMHDNDIGDYYVECFVCGAETSDHRCEEPKHAAERWNRRTAIQQHEATPPKKQEARKVPDVVERLREIGSKKELQDKWALHEIANVLADHFERGEQP